MMYVLGMVKSGLLKVCYLGIGYWGLGIGLKLGKIMDWAITYRQILGRVPSPFYKSNAHCTAIRRLPYRTISRSIIRSGVGYRRDERYFPFIIEYPASRRYDCYWLGF